MYAIRSYYAKGFWEGYRMNKLSINYIIARNFRKNIKNYYLYVFALVFSVALYFAFVTLQFDPALEEIKGSIKGEAAIKAGSVLLIAIVTIFLRITSYNVCYTSYNFV